MTRPQLWHRARPAALAIAREWFVKGMDADDVRQEALLALWIAAGNHDPRRGPWPPFARMCVKAHMRDMLQAATRAKRTAVVLELDPERDAAPSRDDAGLRDVIASMSVLTDRERAALSDQLNGRRADDNALWRARRKLKAAA